MAKIAHHEFGATAHAVETSSDRSFGLVFAAAFTLIAAYLAWHGNARWPALLAPAPVFLILALMRPALLAPLNWVWTKVGLLMGAVVAPIVMAFIYFALITPMALIARLVGKDFLGLRRDPAAPTYWLPRLDDDQTPERLRDQF